MHKILINIPLSSKSTVSQSEKLLKAVFSALRKALPNFYHFLFLWFKPPCIIFSLMDSPQVHFKHFSEQFLQAP